MKDTHLGPIGKPLGGISVYLYRLSKLDKKADLMVRPTFMDAYGVRV